MAAWPRAAVGTEGVTGGAGCACAQGQGLSVWSWFLRKVVMLAAKQLGFWGLCNVLRHGITA